MCKAQGGIEQCQNPFASLAEFSNFNGESPMSVFSIRLPDSIHKMARELAKEENVTLNQFVASAVAEKISALTTETYLADRAARGSAGKFRAALSKVPDA